jgi:hypothetical protein
VDSSCSATLALQEIQLALTVLAVSVDLFLVFRLVWWAMLREVPKEAHMSAGEAFRYLGRSLGRWAKEQKELEQA